MATCFSSHSEVNETPLRERDRTKKERTGKKSGESERVRSEK